jgi:hypothetical protein
MNILSILPKESYKISFLVDVIRRIHDRTIMQSSTVCRDIHEICHEVIPDEDHNKRLNKELNITVEDIAKFKA